MQSDLMSDDTWSLGARQHPSWSFLAVSCARPSWETQGKMQTKSPKAWGHLAVRTMLHPCPTVLADRPSLLSSPKKKRPALPQTVSERGQTQPKTPTSRCTERMLSCCHRSCRPFSLCSYPLSGFCLLVTGQLVACALVLRSFALPMAFLLPVILLGFSLPFSLFLAGLRVCLLTIRMVTTLVVACVFAL